MRARLVERAQDWPWSSARAHLSGQPDGITTIAPALERVGDFAAFLGAAHEAASFEPLRRAEITGRPIGGAGFLDALEARLGRAVKPLRRGRKKKDQKNR